MFKEKFYQAKDGTNICYVDEGKGRPIMLIHGFTASKESWINTYGKAFLDAGFRVIAMDMRGSKNTEPSCTRPIGLMRLAEDIHEMIEYLDIQDVTLVGHSQGGKDIMAYEMLFGNEHLHSICLLDTTPCTRQEEGFGYATRFDSYTKEQSDSDISSMQADPMIFFTKLFHDGDPTISMEQAAKIAEQALSGQHIPETVDLYVSTNTLDLRKGVDAISVPTMYLYADKGTLIHPEIYEWFEKHIKSEFYPVPLDTAVHGFPFMPEFIPFITEKMITFFNR